MPRPASLLLTLAAGCGHAAGTGSVPAASPASSPTTTATATAAAPAASKNPCRTDPAFAQFDFWLGEWVVHDPKGVKQGDNRITKVEQGCLILERWTSVRGNTGQSYNYYDPVTGKWRQVWVSKGMSIDYEGGLRFDGVMVLTGEIHYHNGTRYPFRGEWTPLPDGRVRQHFEQYDPEKETWAPWFTGLYRRK